MLAGFGDDLVEILERFLVVLARAWLESIGRAGAERRRANEVESGLAHRREELADGLDRTGFGLGQAEVAAPGEVHWVPADDEVRPVSLDERRWFRFNGPARRYDD